MKPLANSFAKLSMPPMPPPDKIHMWVIYDHPVDYPDHYVARRFCIERSHAGARGLPLSVISDDLEAIRAVMVRIGLTCLSRSPEDDAKIIESWI